MEGEWPELEVEFSPEAELCCGEIACIVSHPDYRGGERGQRLLAAIEDEARRQGLDRVFVLTTQTAHWFLEQGFVETQTSSVFIFWILYANKFLNR